MECKSISSQTFKKYCLVYIDKVSSSCLESETLLLFVESNSQTVICTATHISAPVTPPGIFLQPGRDTQTHKEFHPHDLHQFLTTQDLRTTCAGIFPCG